MFHHKLTMVYYDLHRPAGTSIHYWAACHSYFVRCIHLTPAPPVQTDEKVRTAAVAERHSVATIGFWICWTKLRWNMFFFVRTLIKFVRKRFSLFWIWKSKFSVSTIWILICIFGGVSGFVFCYLTSRFFFHYKSERQRQQWLNPESVGQNLGEIHIF